MSSSLPVGRRVVLFELGETPLEAVEQHMRLEPMEPPALAPRDVLVAVKSASVGWVDLIMASGQYQHALAPPYTPGLEYAGVVAAIGSEVRAFAVGDEVLSDGLATGPRSHGDHQRFGGYASYALAPEHGLLRVPRGMNLDQACNFLGSYETAYHCLVTRGRLSAGETVLVHGASGATGLAAVHVAKLVGARVIATGRSEDKLAVVAAEGADHVIVTKGDADHRVRSFRDEVKTLTGGRGVDVVYDGVGGAVSLESLRCVRFGARFLVVGWASTPFVARGKGLRGAPNANMLPTNLILMKGLDVLGCPTAIATKEDPSIRAPRLAALLDWANAGRLRPHVSKAFPLDAFASAMRAKWAGEIVGGAVLHP